MNRRTAVVSGGTFLSGAGCLGTLETGELRIELTRRHGGSDECDDPDRLVSYRVVVTVGGSLPDVVEVTENADGRTRVERGLSFP